MFQSTCTPPPQLYSFRPGWICTTRDTLSLFNVYTSQLSNAPTRIHKCGDLILLQCIHLVSIFITVHYYPLQNNCIIVKVATINQSPPPPPPPPPPHVLSGVVIGRETRY